MSYKQEYERWLHSDALSPAEHAELERIAGDEKEIENRFYGPLEFGTAGLRGTMKVGLHQMNIHVIRWATQGFANVIAAEGEDGFRARESAQTARFAKEGRQLLSCGGGIIKRGENLRALHQNGVVLFIDRPLDALTVGGGRPLSSSPEALRQMEAERRPLYLAAADAVIPNSGTVEDAVAAAMEALDEIFSH